MKIFIATYWNSWLTATGTFLSLLLLDISVWSLKGRRKYCLLTQTGGPPKYMIQMEVIIAAVWTTQANLFCIPQSASHPTEPYFIILILSVMIHNVPVRQSIGHKTIWLISVLSHNPAVKHIIGHKTTCWNISVVKSVKTSAWKGIIKCWCIHMSILETVCRFQNMIMYFYNLIYVCQSYIRTIRTISQDYYNDWPPGGIWWKDFIWNPLKYNYIIMF